VVKPAKIRISQSELDVMDVLWTQNPLGASEVGEVLATHKDWNIRTIKTLLARLVEKADDIAELEALLAKLKDGA